MKPEVSEATGQAIEQAVRSSQREALIITFLLLALTVAPLVYAFLTT